MSRTMSSDTPCSTRSSRALAHRPVLLVAAWLGASAAPVLADPLNPMDFPSLGPRTLLAATYTVNTSANPPTLTGPGTNLVGTVLTGTTPSEVAVFRFDALTIGGTVNVTGSRAVAFLSSGSLDWNANLNANGGAGGQPNLGAGGAGGTPGPGGFAGGNGGQAIGGGEWGRGAGGGGSDGAILRDSSGGGFGGAAFSGAPGFRGGEVNGVQPNFVLGGGSGGGGGGGNGSQGGGYGGGGGGGAVELGALGPLTIVGIINVSGGAGAGGPPSSQAGRGGGGSGGAVLLHGLTVSIPFGSVNASGGQGGAGSTVGGGGGGGGRVHIQCPGGVNTSAINVQGGLSGGPGFVASSAGIVTVAHPQLTVWPLLLDFGSVPLSSSAKISVFVQNTGDAGTVIYGSFPGAPYPVYGQGTVPINGLRPGMSIEFAYVFQPTSLTFLDALSTLRTNGGTASLHFVGMSVIPPVLACNPADIATAGNPDPLAGPDGFITGEDFDAFVILYFKGC